MMGKYSDDSLTQFIMFIAYIAVQTTITTIQQSQNIQRRPNVSDAGPTLYKSYTDVLFANNNHY